jgi:transcriptional regulator with XRE-family HTH domain
MSNHQTYRFCGSCGTKLAVGARSPLCRSCGQHPEATPVESVPPAAPDTVWGAPALLQAFEAQDFGLVLLAYRKAFEPVVTQTEVARWLGVSQSQVSRMEAGQSLTSDIGKIARWAKALRIPQHFLWFELSTEPSHAYRSVMLGSTLLSSSHEAEGDHMRRRGFFKVAAATGASFANVSRSPMAAPPHKLGNPDVEIVREMTSTFRKIDNRHGGGHSHVRMAVRSYLDSTKPLTRDSSRLSIKGDLLAAKAELYQLAGWIDYDTGHLAQGGEHLARALELCREAGDNALQAEIYAAMSHHAAFFSQTNEFIKAKDSRSSGAHGAEASVRHAAAARESAKRSGLWALQAEAAAMEAHGLALRRDRHESIKAMIDAERAFERIQGQDVPSWLSYFDAAYLSAKFAHTLRDLGLPNEAGEFARRSLQMSEGYDRGRLFNTILLASIVADQGQVEEACQIGLEALQMSERIRSVRVIYNLADLAQRLDHANQSPSVGILLREMSNRGVPIPEKQG